MRPVVSDNQPVSVGSKDLGGGRDGVLNGLGSGAMGDTSRSSSTEARKRARVDERPVCADGVAGGVNSAAMTSVLSRAYLEALDCALSGLRPAAMDGVLNRVSPEAVSEVVNGAGSETLSDALHKSNLGAIGGEADGKATKLSTA